jgi:hypothetical protein
VLPPLVLLELEDELDELLLELLEEDELDELVLLEDELDELLLEDDELELDELLLAVLLYEQ